MLQRGWMVRYVPPRAMEYVPDLVIASGYVWAGLMFASAALNLFLALETSILVWGSVMSAWGNASKAALFVLQYGYMRFVGHRRYLARTAAVAA
jgi:intracellular septation protein